jgi:hypothetical protein
MNASIKNIASLLSTLGACLSLSVLGTGCILVDGSGRTGGGSGSGTVVVSGGTTTSDPAPSDPAPSDPTPVDTTPAVADITIDPGASMSASPGEGVGLFVQYAGDGHWDVFTTCDTSISGASCNFDVLVSADPSVALWNVEGADLDPGDTLSLNSDGSIQLVTDTSFGMNGMSFDAEPGATIEIDVLLDGDTAERFVYAVSDGALLQGVPTNPVDFTPAF